MQEMQNRRKHRLSLGRWTRIGVWALLAHPFFMNAYAEQPAVLDPVQQAALDPQIKIWLVGQSTLHAYSSTATKIRTSIEFQRAKSVPAADESVFERIKKGQMKKLDVSIPVNEMKSGGNQLDRNMRKSLKASDHPLIQFHLLNCHGLIGYP